MKTFDFKTTVDFAKLCFSQFRHSTSMDNVTPMFRQYLEIKKLYPGTILFFRLGDFYEMFNEDAVIGSRELEITLTARQKDSSNPIPMCGVPYHAAAKYIARLVKKGYRVAICEQAEPASKGTKLVRREVVRVITPGTAVDPQLVSASELAYLAALSGADGRYGAAFLDISTGEFCATEAEGPESWARIMSQLESFSPKEILHPASLRASLGEAFGVSSSDRLPVFGLSGDRRSIQTGRGLVTLTELEDRYFHADNCSRVLNEQFRTRELKGFGLEGKVEAIRAAGACLQYAKDTQKAEAEHISEISCFGEAEHMVLDAITLSNLEILESRSEGEKRSLFKVIDQTVTGMGGRLLRSWLTRPSIKRSEIQTRLSAVTELTDTLLRDQVRFLLKEVSDLERLVGRLNLGAATPRDLLSLCRALHQTPRLTSTLSDVSSLLLQVLSENIFELPEIRDLIDRSIADDPSATLNEGGIIKRGFNSELDELHDVSASGKQTIALFEDREKQRTGISNLKVRFNNLFGYYIEISKGNLSRVPDDYERRQTLANAERFTTPELKEWERKVLGAEERIVQLEQEIFADVRDRVRSETQRLQSTARALATLDALASLAEVATRRNYVAPQLHDGDEIEIKNGRHPIVEAYSEFEFVPNDTYLNNSTDRLLIVTGANMGGKSTVLRQIALIQVLAQIGSYVPADSARLPIVDRVWTRVGASDDLASGRSTFMVEMTETAQILHNATARSLVLLDEIGRGTSTFDGLSIAWAVAEFLHNSPQHSAKTIFATHYHELTELAEHLPGAKNYQLTAIEKDGEVVFLHKLARGKASKSYGIAVAQLAGLPRSVIERAKAVLQKLEKYELAVFADETANGIQKAAGMKAAAQVSLFAISNENVLDELRTADVSALTGDEAKRLLEAAKKRLI
jgi:DNA mismatch repair protein MutS